MSRKKFKLALCQLRTELDLDSTMAKASAMVALAAEKGADVVVLPEMFNCPYSKEYFKSFALLGHESSVEAMSRWARENKVLLIGGSVPEKAGDRLYNTAYVFDKEGQCIAKHRKVHLFDIDMPGMRFKESATFAPGGEVTVFDTEFGKMGLAICFDLRFAELFRSMARKGAELVLLPAQFNMTTGPRHWELLLRSRAVDNQLFVAACAAARYEGFSYECWGHSTVAGPMGEVLYSCDEKEQILYADIDLEAIDDARARLPVFSGLRSDVYAVTD